MSYQINSYGIGTIGSQGAGDGQFTNPMGSAVDGTYLYIFDQNNSRVEILDKVSGSYVGQFGSQGSADGQFEKQTGPTVYGGRFLAIDSSYIYTMDVVNARVQKFNISSPYDFVGKFTPDLGGSYSVGSNNGRAIAVDSNYIYVNGTRYDKTTFAPDTVYTTWTGLNSQLLVDGSNLYVTSGSGISRISISGDTVQASNGSYTGDGIAVDSTYVYIRNGSNIYILDKTSLVYVGTVNTSMTRVGLSLSSGVFFMSNSSGTVGVYSINKLTGIPMSLFNSSKGAI